MEFFLIFSIVLVTLITCTLSYIKWNYAHWERKKIPYIKPTFPFGNVGGVFSKKRSFGFEVKQHYDVLKSKGHKYGGLFNILAPVYMPIDLELIKDVTIKSFDFFMDRGFYYNEKDDPMSAHLFSIEGQTWKRLRRSISPALTSGKIKIMFDTLLECTKPLKNTLDQMVANKMPLDVKETVARFATDVIGSFALGLECNNFKSPETDFRKYGKKVFERTTFEFFKLLFLLDNPNLGRRLRIPLLPRDTTDFFMKVIKDAMALRESSNYYRRDLVQLLVELKHKKPELDEVAFTENELAAQAFVFFIGAFETTALSVTMLLYELSVNQDIQQKVRNEIESVLKRYNGKVTYDCLADLKYTTQCVEEALRLHPPVSQLQRICTEDYTIPDTDIVLEKGTRVFIPTLGLHRDLEYFPDPDKFDPDRFSEENRKNMHSSTYLPFGEGPRRCIGTRFAMMEIKAVLVVLLKDFKFTINKNTSVPFKVDPGNLNYAPEGLILLDFEKVVG